MSSPQFNVVVDGHPLAGFDAHDVLLQLQQQLKLPSAKAEQLLAGRPVTVKRAIDEAVAQAYCQRLQALGVSARTVAAAAPSPTTDATVVPSYFSRTPLQGSGNSARFLRALYAAAARGLLTGFGYAAVAALAVGLFIFYLLYFAYLLTAPPIAFSATLYLLPLFALALLALLLLRPFLPAVRARRVSTLLRREQQPQLFAFVEQLCAALTLPVPSELAVSARPLHEIELLPGLNNFMRGNYRLILSLPLLEACTITQFGAGLAAVLGTRGSGPALRCHGVLRALASRYQACLDGEDWLQRGLSALQRRMPALAAPVRGLRALCAQSDRQLQKVTARFERIQARLQRAQQLESDRYLTTVAGAAALEEVLVLEDILASATADAETKNREERIDGGLVDDLPALIAHYREALGENHARELRRRWQSEPTPRSDAPSIARERIERAETAAQAGVLTAAEAAATLLAHRTALAARVTLDSYRSAGLAVESTALMPVDSLTYAATQDILQRQQAAVYFNNWFQPYRFWSLADYQLIRDMPLQDAAQQLSVCVNEIRRLTPDRMKLLAEYERLQNQIQEILIGQQVIAAGKSFQFRYAQYDGNSLQPQLDDRQRQLAKVTEQLALQEAVMGGRLTLGLRLSGQAERDIQELHDALRLLHDIGARLYKFALDTHLLQQLVQRHHNLREADYSAAIKRLEQKLHDAGVLLQVRLNDIPYPLDPRYRSLKDCVERVLQQHHREDEATASPALAQAQRLVTALQAINDRLSLQAAEFGTIAEEAYRIEPIKLVAAP